MKGRSTIPKVSTVSGAVLTAVACVLAISGSATGAQDGASIGDSALDALKEAAPRGAAADLSNVQVSPKQIRGGQATIRFSLDRGARVTLLRLREAGTETDKGFIRVTPRPVAAGPGRNEVRVPAPNLGHRPGQYLLRAHTLGPDGSADFASTLYRVLRKR